MGRWLAVLLAVTVLVGGIAFAATGPEAVSTLKQFTSAGHVLGFEIGGYYLSNGMYALRVTFEDARAVTPATESSRAEALDGKAAPLSRVTYFNLWPGISVTYDAPRGGIARSTWTVAAGVDPALIQLKYNGAVALTAAGNLSIRFAAGAITESRPVAWQEVDGKRQAVEVGFATSDHDVVGFRVGAYRQDLPLIIDPTTTWNTFLGSATIDTGGAIAVDTNGNVYVVGSSDATWGTPVTAFTTDDAFVAKLDAAGSLIWNTFLGGSTSGDSAAAITLDPSGNVYVSGSSSGTWGSPVNAYTPSLSDAYVAKLDSDGALIWNTFVGGGGYDFGGEIALDGAGNVYTAGGSEATWGSPVRAYTFNYDVFVAKLDSSGAVTWNTFLGGSDADEGGAIAVDGSGNVYVAGNSFASWGSPVRAHTAFWDGFVARLDSTGALIWNTFLGGSGTDYAHAVTVDASGGLYVAGGSGAIWGSPVRAYTDSTFDGFAARLDSDGALVWNTFLGGSFFDEAVAITADNSGNVYVTGESGSTWGNPINAFVDLDSFAAQLDSTGTLHWNMFLGGSGQDLGIGIAVDSTNNLYVAGYSTESWGNPVRAYSPSGNDVYVAQIALVEDSVVLPLKPLKVKVGGGDAGLSKIIKVQVRNGNLLGEEETGARALQLLASDGDCPPGTVGSPDFDADTAGDQDIVFVPAGKSAKALVPLNVVAASFTTFNHVAPARCTLSFSVSSPGASDPSPSNNTAPLELNVFDNNDAEQSTVHETFVKSIKPLKLTIGDGNVESVKTAKPSAGNADILPEPEELGDSITVTATDGDCPAGTLGVVDYDKDAPGGQDTVTIRGGKTATGKIGVTAAAANFVSSNKKSPARCVATISVTGPGGDTDGSNDTTNLVIDVYDKNDF